MGDTTANTEPTIDGRRARFAHPLRLRPNVLGTGEQIGIRGNGAVRRANIALDAHIRGKWRIFQQIQQIDH